MVYSEEQKMLVIGFTNQIINYQFKDAGKCNAILICCKNREVFLQSIVDMIWKTDAQALLKDGERRVENDQGDIINVSFERNEKIGGANCDYVLYFIKMDNINDPIAPIKN